MLLKIPIRLQFLVFSLLDFELQFCTCSWQLGVGRASRARVIGSETRLCCEIDCVFGVFSLFKSKQICVISDKLFLRFRYSYWGQIWKCNIVSYETHIFRQDKAGHKILHQIYQICHWNPQYFIGKHDTDE